jgi:dTMP kinase
MRKGKFIVIDGVDGSGKGTQIALLKRKFGKRVLFTHEPGGTKLAEEIRTVLLARKRAGTTPLTDFFLFWAARASHVENTIKPALARGRSIICDRFDSSTFAFQVEGEQQPELKKIFYECRSAIVGNSAPDCYIILDIPARAAMKRRRSDSHNPATPFDMKSSAYHERVRRGFKKFKPAGSKVFFVDANHSPEAVHKEIWRIVERALR